MTIIEIGYKDENGNPQTYMVGDFVYKITCHAAQGEGDKWFYDIHLKNGDVITVFDPLRVVTRNSNVNVRQEPKP